MNQPPLVYTGTLCKMFNTEIKGKYSYRLFWLQNDWMYRKKNGEYINGISYSQFKLLFAKCSLIDNFNIGDVLSVQFEIKGRIWEGKIIQDLEVIQLHHVGFNAIKEADTDDPDNKRIMADRIIHESTSHIPVNTDPDYTLDESNDLPF